MILELARAWSTAPTNRAPSCPTPSSSPPSPPKSRACSAREYLGQHPPIPAGQIALDINYDMILPIGVPLEINVNGAQRTSFYPDRRSHRQSASTSPSSPTPDPAAGSYYRSDHFSPLPRRHPRLLHRNRQPLRRPRRAWGKKQARRLHRPRLPQLLRQLSRRLGLRRQRQTRSASAWTSAGRSSPLQQPINWNQRRRIRSRPQSQPEAVTRISTNRRDRSFSPASNQQQGEIG